MKFCPYFSQRLVNLLNLVHGKSEHWKQCVILFSKQHKWNVLHFSQRELFSSAPLQGLFSLVYMGHPPTKDTTSRNTTIIRLDFSYSLCHPKISKRKLISLYAFVLPLLYSLFFQRKDGLLSSLQT